MHPVSSQIPLAEIVSFLHFLEKNSTWFFSLSTLGFFLKRNPDQYLAGDLSYYIEAGLIEHVGDDIYAFIISSMIPFNAQELLVHALRPSALNYISFETALNDYSIISQIPTLLTVATTGKDGFYESKSYRIEFIHVDHDWLTISQNCYYSQTQDILFASPLFALSDLCTLNRNTHLIQEDEIEEAQAFYESRQDQ